MDGSKQGLGHQLLSLPLWIVLILPFARILATGLSIGSGGSGGIFGPGMVIGAFIGASVWRLFEPVVPSMGHSPAPYVIVGMMCCFGGISRAPLAVMLMVAEMTGSLSILAPAMIAVGLAWFIVRRSDDTIYRSQLKSQGRCSGPTPVDRDACPVQCPGSQAMAPPRLVITGGTSSSRRSISSRWCAPGAPVVDGKGGSKGRSPWIISDHRARVIEARIHGRVERLLRCRIRRSSMLLLMPSPPPASLGSGPGPRTER